MTDYLKALMLANSKVQLMELMKESLKELRLVI
jgi:hypothetical protein